MVTLVSRVEGSPLINFARVLVCGMIFLALSGGCSSPSRIEGSDALLTAIVQVNTRDKTILIREVTDFPWDGVAVFSEATDVSEIEEVVGSTDLGESYWVSTRSLFVFIYDGEVTRTIEVNGGTFDAESYERVFNEDAFFEPSPTAVDVVKIDSP